MSVKLSEPPLISIVVPSYNQGKFIEQAITSVLGQNYENLELIVIDGGSNDETMTIVEKYADSIAYYVSEPDNGQAHAINKGFRLARGEILGWLNSDDMYLPCTLSKAVNTIGDSKEPTLVYGGCLHFSENQSRAYGIIPQSFDREKLTYQDYIIQPSTFWTRSLWNKVGELNEFYHYALDWDWFIRASKLCEFVLMSDYLSIYRLHDTHKTGTGGLKRREEFVKVVETHATDYWIEVYRDVYKQVPSLKAGLDRLMKMKLYRFRSLFYPQFYLKYGHERINTLLMMM